MGYLKNNAVELICAFSIACSIAFAAIRMYDISHPPIWRCYPLGADGLVRPCTFLGRQP
jgi:hypothetical protein